MKNQKKGFVVPLLIVIIAVLAIGGGTYYYSQNFPITDLPTTTQTTDWKTYTNNDLGFSLRYPIQWEEPEVSVWSKGTEISFERNAPLYITESSQSQYGIEGQTFNINDVVDKETLSLSRQGNISDLKREKTTIAGKEAVKISYVSKGTPLAGTKLDAPVVIKQVVAVYMIPPNYGGVFLLSYEYSIDNNQTSENNFLNQILSSITFKDKVEQTTSTDITNDSNIRLIGFEEAVNNNNWIESQRYLSNNVYVVLEGSSCCGERTQIQAGETLNNFTGLRFTFDENNTLVKEYLNYTRSQYPSGRKIWGNVDFFTDLKIGVENDATQENKATIGYKVENGKITVLFINPGRDR